MVEYFAPKVQVLHLKMLQIFCPKGQNRTAIDSFHLYHLKVISFLSLNQKNLPVQKLTSFEEYGCYILVVGD